MRIEKRTLAHLPLPYAAAKTRIDGRDYFLAASEDRNKCLLFRPPRWESSVVWEGPGGCMGFAGVPGRRGGLLAIQKFFPEFRGNESCLVYAEPQSELTRAWDVRHVLDMPFLHRIEVVKISDRPVLVAGTVCGGKAFAEDWSQPGAVYAAPIPEDPAGEWTLEPIMKDISKNHGMHLTTLNDRQVVMVSGTEGLFALEVPTDVHSQWHYQTLLEHEVSDVRSFDLDADGVSELITIEPFHGNRLAVYKHGSGCWREIFHTELEWGHVIWAGMLAGQSTIIGGGLAGDKELFVLSPKTPGRWDPTTLERRVVDAGVGPAQVAVVPGKDRDLVLSANNESGEVALYEFGSQGLTSVERRRTSD